MKTAELAGRPLNYAVALALGYKIAPLESDENSLAVQAPTGTIKLIMARSGLTWITYGAWDPSKDWAQGGPIIEKAGIGVYVGATPERWMAAFYGREGEHIGPTPLVAAMRCFVASKLGDEVDIPKELT